MWNNNLDFDLLNVWIIQVQVQFISYKPNKWYREVKTWDKSSILVLCVMKTKAWVVCVFQITNHWSVNVIIY
jgi:hypothetical protein